MLALNSDSFDSLQEVHSKVFVYFSEKSMRVLEAIARIFLTTAQAYAFKLLKPEEKTFESLQGVYVLDSLTLDQAFVLLVLEVVTVDDVQAISKLGDVSKLQLKTLEHMSTKMPITMNIVEIILKTQLTEEMQSVIKQLETPSVKLLQKLQTVDMSNQSCTHKGFKYFFSLEETHKNCLENEEDISGCLQDLSRCDFLN